MSSPVSPRDEDAHDTKPFNDLPSKGEMIGGEKQTVEPHQETVEEAGYHPTPDERRDLLPEEYQVARGA